MAFVHRTTRENCRIGGFVSDTSSNDTAHLAPGYYDVESGMKKLQARTKAHSRAPFSTAAQRSDPTDKSWGPAPGPGTYDTHAKHSELGLPGCRAAFASTSDRLAQNKDVDALPGPGAYDTSRRALKRKKAQPKRQRPIASKPSETIPSIPSGKYSFGYEEAEGKLIPRQPIATQAETISETDRNSSLAKKAEKGIDFSKQTSRERRDRAHQRQENTPGPGEYYRALDGNSTTMALESGFIDPAQKERVRPRLQSAFASRSKRSNGTTSKDASLIPGPGAYATEGTQCTSKTAPHGKKTQALFGSTVERFKAPADAGLDAPAFYHSSYKSCFKDDWSARAKRYGRGNQNIGFNSGAPRTAPSNGSRVRSGSGPEFYNFPGMVDKLKLKETMNPKRGSASFGSTSRRFHTPGSADDGSRRLQGQKFARSQCGPQQRNAMALVPRSGSSKAQSVTSIYRALPVTGAGCSSVFRSRTKRGIAEETKGTVPPPGTYNTADVHALAKAVASKPGKGIMMSRTNRASSTSERAEDSSHLGPGAYNSNRQSSKPTSRKQGFFSESARFDHQRTKQSNNTNPTPGPGHYSSNADFGTSLLKPTFNLTIAEEEERALIRRGIL